MFPHVVTEEIADEHDDTFSVRARRS